MSQLQEKKLYQLYLIATPIGNFSEITFRALEVIKHCDELYCEDTRVTKKLLTHYVIEKHLTPYHDHNENTKTQEIIDKIKAGKTIGVVSDAGMPSISDPGYKIVDAAINEGIEFTVISGASSFVNALVLSGLPTHNFFFGGFLPPKGKKRTDLLEKYLGMEVTTILFESTYKIEKLINELNSIDKNIILVVTKEISKLHETVLRGRVEDFVNGTIQLNKKGEFVVLFNGKIREINE